MHLKTAQCDSGSQSSTDKVNKKSAGTLRIIRGKSSAVMLASQGGHRIRPERYSGREFM